MRPQDRILAVDDDPQNLVVFEELLGEDYELQTLDGGRRVLETARTFRPDLVLLDIMMPDVNGYDVCRQIRSDAELRRTKVVLVSAKSLVEERLQGYEAGADDYIAKPFALDEFVAKVRVHLRLKSAEELDDLKSQFLTLLSHETRTPLAAIMSASEILAADNPLPPEQRESLTRIIVESASRMHRLLDRVTLLSRVKSGNNRYEREDFDLEQLVKSLVPSATSKLSAAGVGVSVRGCADAAAVGDQQGVHMILEAVLDNAIRFSPAGSEIRIDVSRGDDNVVVAIADQGPGIEPALLARIWEGFQVGDLAHHGSGHGSGHGISLALAHGMLTSLGGSIDIESKPGRGTRVMIALPAARRLAA